MFKERTSGLIKRSLNREEEKKSITENLHKMMVANRKTDRLLSEMPAVIVKGLENLKYIDSGKKTEHLESASIMRKIKNDWALSRYGIASVMERIVKNTKHWRQVLSDGGGDCNDLSIYVAKQTLAGKSSFSSENTSFVFGMVKFSPTAKSGVAHAWLETRIDGKDYIVECSNPQQVRLIAKDSREASLYFMEGRSSIKVAVDAVNYNYDKQQQRDKNK